jgi:acyl-coenzyme A thioesterase PaaI-like protein
MLAMDPVAAGEFETMAWSTLMGFEMPHSAPGEVTLRIDPKPEFHNQNGTVAAPISFALAEAAGAAVIVMGFLDLLADTYTVVREARLEFVAAARGPISATARLDPARIDEIRAIVVAGGEVDEAMELEVVDESGRVVARVAQTLTIRPTRS